MKTVQSYKQADTLLQGRCLNSRKLANNTYLKRQVDGSIGVKLHSTYVVMYNQDGTIVLNSGGWRTPTTKDRLNTFSPAGIWQKNSVWYIGSNWDRSIRTLYHDGIRLDSDGLPIGSYDIETKDHKKQRRHLLKQIKAYAKLCADSCPIEEPSNGDCWGCLFVDKDNKPGMGNSHILEHFKEGYVVPSLVYQACKRFGVSHIAQQYLVGGENSFYHPIAKRQIQSAVYRFVKQQFGLAS